MATVGAILGLEEGVVLGPSVPTPEGWKDGVALGFPDKSVGSRDGDALGHKVNAPVGNCEGNAFGSAEIIVGTADGIKLVISEGDSLGEDVFNVGDVWGDGAFDCVGEELGYEDDVGILDMEGASVGNEVGSSEGCPETTVGSSEGDSLGCPD
uniref:Uncharacterized protein n=1 Tax=Pseudictyota dubia TaxID=2749911 RepID=A0A7R9W5K2_9STRA|mmetsp:Transcript_32961/g.60743  ORF Transcript_32961/g.60743 Transcript_32961/m.60743 type:complete len:153 (+) Transcript_32961:809-1267(+)